MWTEKFVVISFEDLIEIFKDRLGGFKNKIFDEQNIAEFLDVANDTVEFDGYTVLCWNTVYNNGICMFYVTFKRIQE